MSGRDGAERGAAGAERGAAGAERGAAGRSESANLTNADCHHHFRTLRNSHA